MRLVVFAALVAGWVALVAGCGNSLLPPGTCEVATTGATPDVQLVALPGGSLYEHDNHAELSRDATTSSWAVIGPDLAWQRGRFLLTGALGIGIEHITAAPRLNLGMMW